MHQIYTYSGALQLTGIAICGQLERFNFASFSRGPRCCRRRFNYSARTAVRRDAFDPELNPFRDYYSSGSSSLVLSLSLSLSRSLRALLSSTFFNGILISFRNLAPASPGPMPSLLLLSLSLSLSRCSRGVESWA